MSKKRINFTIEKKLHEWAKAHAEKNGSNFSAYVSALISEDMSRAAGEVKLTASERAGLRREVAEEVLQALLKQTRGG